MDIGSNAKARKSDERNKCLYIQVTPDSPSIYLGPETGHGTNEAIHCTWASRMVSWGLDADGAIDPHDDVSAST